MPMRKIVSQRIEKLRLKKLKLSQVEFAQVLGLELPKGRSTINNWEQGAVQVKSDDLTLIAQKCGVSTDWLLGVVDENNYTNDETIRLISEHTGLSTEAVNALHGSAYDLDRGGITVTVSSAPTQERRVVDALLTTAAGKEILKDLYSYLFNKYDTFIMHGKDENGNDITLESDTITMHGSDLPIYEVHPDDVKDMIARKIYRSLNDLQREANETEEE